MALTLFCILPVRGEDLVFDARFYSSDALAVASKTPFSYDDYIAALRQFVNKEGLVNYKALRQSRVGLDRFLLAMAAVTRETYAVWGEKDRIAFWSNAYNALTLRLIIDHYLNRKENRRWRT
jgi:hypothetical protein